MSDEGEWFMAKRFGFGPGLPIRWQGYALLIGYLAIMIGLGLALHDRPAQAVASLILPTLAFMVIACRTTRGGCRWRTGEND